jgi:hypothetical protein
MTTAIVTDRDEPARNRVEFEARYATRCSKLGSTDLENSGKDRAEDLLL